MTETIQSTVFEHSMSSQAPLTGLQSYSNLRPGSSFIIGADPNHSENSASRQHQQHEFVQHPAGAPEMGLGFMTNLESSDDSRYPSDAATAPHQSHYSNIEHTQVPSNPSSVPFYPSVFPPNALSSNASQYSNPSTPYLNQHSNPVSNYTSYSSSLSEINMASGVGGPSRSPHRHTTTLIHNGPENPGNAKAMYSGGMPSLSHSLPRRAYTNDSPTRNVPMSPSSSSGFTSPQQIHMDSPHLHGSGSAGSNVHDPPPLQEMRRLHENIATADGIQIRPDIIGKIDKGFFLAENDWTCYRRNYFQVSVSYTLSPMVPAGSPIYLSMNGQSHQIQAWAMTISAVVDNEQGKPIELVMHTPKRDKGPQLKIEKQVLVPRSSTTTSSTYAHGGVGSLASIGNISSSDGSRPVFDSAGGIGGNFSSATQPPLSEHTFERIQFKQATANNGKRRARQQYYHLMLELWVDLGASSGLGEKRWQKVGYRISPPMVVRGRSPGHYHAERRGSNASGGASGQNGNMGGYGPGGQMMGQPGMGRPGSIGMGGGQQYGNAYGAQIAREHCERFGLSIPAEPIMTQEEEEMFKGQSGYSYYPSAISEPNILQTALPPFQHRQDQNQGYRPPIKQEYTGYGLPSPNSIGLRPLGNGSSNVDNWGRQCGGRFEGTNATRGYYPIHNVHSDVNAS